MDRPVGLLGEQMKISLVRSFSALMTPAASREKSLDGSSQRRRGTWIRSAPWIVVYSRYMSNVGGHTSTASVRARTKGPDQDVDGFAAAAGYQYFFAGNAVVPRKPVPNRFGARRRITVESARRRVPRSTVGRFVGVQADAAGFMATRRVGNQRPQFGPNEIQDIVARNSSHASTSNRLRTAVACASSPSSEASRSAMGPTARNPSAVSVCTVIVRRKSATPSPE